MQNNKRHSQTEKDFHQAAWDGKIDRDTFLTSKIKNHHQNPIQLESWEGWLTQILTHIWVAECNASPSQSICTIFSSISKEKGDKSIMEENDWNQRSMSRTSVKWTSRSGGDKTHMLCFSSFYRSVYKYRCLDLSIQPLLFLIVVSRAPANWIMEADSYQAINCNQVPPSDHHSVPLGWTWHVQ